MAVKLITSYTNIKADAKDLGKSEEELAKEEGERTVGGNDDWDLDLTLRTAQFNAAKIEHLKLIGSR